MKGRIASLLEVGTGFHPEMTGRENIYQNGAILGMTRHEITRKFDEIVDFSGCEAYIDTPVKRYSSGMYVRLAFAVAAHLESEILIVDEVLAVGDAEFQKKCLGKMNDVAKGEGRTVLFVSHNMGAVSNFCNKGMLLESGMLTFESYNLNKVIAKYIESSNSIKSYWFLSEDKPLNSNEYFNPKAIYLVSKSGEKNKSVFSNNEEVGVIIEGELIEKSSLLSIGFALYTNNNELLYWSLNTDQIVNDTPDIKIGNNKLICWLPKHFLNEGIYQIHLLIGLHFVRSLFEPQKNSPYITFEIKGGLSFSPYWHTARPGLLAPLLTFKQI
jgi:lipopolysaccharide transport system ATP-binding protein